TLGERGLGAACPVGKLTQCHRGQANSGFSAERRSAALGTPEARYRCRPSTSKINVVGSDSTEKRRAGAGGASRATAVWATSPRSSQTWPTTRRTRSQGPHHGALKWTTVGPLRDRPRSAVF